MPQPISPDNLDAIRELFFERLAKANHDLVQTFSELEPYIDNRNHNTILALLDEGEHRIQTMRTILIVFRECLEG
jgi:hypothetical protein